jgi:replicative DNA helicase Mcm
MGKKQKKKAKKVSKSSQSSSSSSIETNDTDNTNETNDTNDTHTPKKPFVSFVVCLKDFLSVLFRENLTDQILGVLAQSETYLPYVKIAEKLNKSEHSIRQAINRKKEYFDIIKPNGKIVETHVTQLAVDEINARLEHLQQLEQQKKDQEDRLKLKEIQQEEYLQEVKSFLHNHKLKRDGHVIVIDFNDMLTYSPTLADLILDNPNKFFKQMEEHYPEGTSFKLKHIPRINKLHIEELRRENLNKLLVLEGRVTSLGEVKPVISSVIFECPSCGALIKKKQNYRVGLLKEPVMCSCGRRGGFVVDDRKEVNACFVQLEDLAENTDNPHSQRIKGALFNDLCVPDIVKRFTPGNEVRCVGVLKEVPVMKGKTKTVFINWIFEILEVELIEKEIEVSKFSEEDIEMINELSVKIDNEGIEHLYDSFAPEVHGYEAIKGAMILQLCNKRNEPKIKAVRNKSNILMIGEPGVAKSVLGDFALKVSSGGRKAVGGGSSAVGITASVVKEEDSLGGYRVEPGAMILAKDVLFIDELNNLQEEDKPKLQEGMNEQRISINKANLHVQMKVTCGIIAAANPIYGHFKADDKLTLQEQFNIPTPIINRFDSIFVINDIINEETDKKIAKKMIHRQTGSIKTEYDIPFLKKFFVYIKQYPDPKIPLDTQKLFQEVYSKARMSYNPGVKINPRFLESLTRMSISSAKLRQSDMVEIKDINNALRILSQTQYKVEENLLMEVK